MPSRKARLGASLLVVTLFVLGPLSLAAYACHHISKGGHGHGHGHGGVVKPPTKPPVKPPSKPPTKPPTKPTDPTKPDPGVPGNPGGQPGGDSGGTPGGTPGGNPGGQPTPEPTVQPSAQPAAPTPTKPKPTGKVKSSAPAKKKSSTKPKPAPTKLERTGASPSGGQAVAAAAAAPTIVAAVNGSDDDGSKGSKGDSKGSNGAQADADRAGASEIERRTTIARAVDGIPLAFKAALLALLFATAILAVVSFRERRRATAVARIAQLDHLTGLANREGFDRQLAIEWARAERHGRPLGMVFMDLDHFKAFNDTQGHLAGDRLLREVAAAITETSRATDFTARLGGDEFVILCPDTDPAGMDRLVERLRIAASGLAVSISVGAASKLEFDTRSDDMVQRADAAMYRMKGGRRRGAAQGNPMLGSMRSRV